MCSCVIWPTSASFFTYPRNATPLGVWRSHRPAALSACGTAPVASTTQRARTSCTAPTDNLLKPLAADWVDFSARPNEFIVDGERMVALGAYAGMHRRTGRSMTSPFAHVWSVRGGKIASFSMYTNTAKVLEATRD